MKSWCAIQASIEDERKIYHPQISDEGTKWIRWNKRSGRFEDDDGCGFLISGLEFLFEWEIYEEKKNPKKWRVKTLQELLKNGWKATGNNLYSSNDNYMVSLMLTYCNENIPYDETECFEWKNFSWTKEMLVEIKE